MVLIRRPFTSCMSALATTVDFHSLFSSGLKSGVPVRVSGHAARCETRARHQSRAWPFARLAFCSTDYRKKRDCSQSNARSLQLQPQTSTLRATLFCQALGTIRKYIARMGRCSWFVTTVFLSVLPTNSQNINVKKAMFNLDQNSVMVLINILDKQVKFKCVLMALIPQSLCTRASRGASLIH